VVSQTGPAAHKGGAARRLDCVPAYTSGGHTAENLQATFKCAGATTAPIGRLSYLPCGRQKRPVCSSRSPYFGLVKKPEIGVVIYQGRTAVSVPFPPQISPAKKKKKQTKTNVFRIGPNGRAAWRETTRSGWFAENIANVCAIPARGHTTGAQLAACQPRSVIAPSGILFVGFIPPRTRLGGSARQSSFPQSRLAASVGKRSLLSRNDNQQQGGPALSMTIGELLAAAAPPRRKKIVVWPRMSTFARPFEFFFRQKTKLQLLEGEGAIWDVSSEVPPSQSMAPSRRHGSFELANWKIAARRKPKAAPLTSARADAPLVRSRDRFPFY